MKPLCEDIARLTGVGFTPEQALAIATLINEGLDDLVTALIPKGES